MLSVDLGSLEPNTYVRVRGTPMLSRMVRYDRALSGASYAVFPLAGQRQVFVQMPAEALDDPTRAAPGEFSGRLMTFGQLGSRFRAVRKYLAGELGMPVTAESFVVLTDEPPSRYGWAVWVAALCVAVIALFYTHTIELQPLLIGATLVIFSFILGTAGVRAMWPYAVIGLIVWVAFLDSGIHATIAGVLLAFSIPHTARYRTEKFPDRMRTLLNRFGDADKEWEGEAPSRVSVHQLARANSSRTTRAFRLRVPIAWRSSSRARRMVGRSRPRRDPRMRIARATSSSRIGWRSRQTTSSAPCAAC